MLKLKEIENRLNKKGISYYRWENNQGIYISHPCDVLTEESLFGYFDKEIPPQNLKDEFRYLKDTRVKICTCAECCGCGDW